MNKETQALFEQTKNLCYTELVQLSNAINEELKARWEKSTYGSMYPELPFSVE